jgi:DNA polymerase V
VKKTCQRGGKRPGAGRPKGTSLYKEPTKPVRIPEGLLSHVSEILKFYRHIKTSGGKDHIFQPMDAPGMELPLYASRVSAGFPSPAEDHMETSLDLNKFLVKHPAATFFVKVQGDSMTGAGIYPGDIIVVDRSLEPGKGKIIVAALNGELTVKRLYYKGKRPFLKAENPNYPSIYIQENMDFMIWGVVTSVIHKV